MARKGYVTLTLTLPSGARKYIYGKTRQEAQEKLDQAKMLLRAGIDLEDGTTVGEYAQMWYNVYKKPNLRQSSKASIVNALNVHILPYLGAVPIQDVTPMAIQNCVNHLSDKSRSLYRTVLQCLRAIFDCAVDDNLIIRSPVPKRMKAKGVKKTPVRALTVEQEKTLLEALDGTRAYLFCWFLLKTGMRRGEALAVMRDALNIKDLENASVHVKRNLVFVNGKSVLENTPKTDAGFREIPLPRDLAEAIREQMSRSSSLFLFPMKNGEMMNENSFRAMWGLVKARKKPDPQFVKKKKEKKIPDRHPDVKRIIDFDVTPHMLRHTYATRCIEKGMDVKEVQYLLGHTDPALTMKIYADYCEEQRKAGTFSKARTAMSRGAASE